jgi:hypothetical protein
MNLESLSHLEELLERYPQRGAQRDIAIEAFTTGHGLARPVTLR